MPLAKDLLHPSSEEERRTHKKKRLVQCPNSYFMDVKCPGCYKITTVFSHAQTVVLCVGCSTVLCQPTGGKARLTEEYTLDGSPPHHRANTDNVHILLDFKIILLFIRERHTEE
ncbi:40S ribosomal protein S27.2 isoform X1 [Nerophis ophidion]|uniref:40S ribosomal protein S27.2 isoform X1 n=1 Tax=Nerophis ophidion TaxID=159077 RepID=UPI002ADFF92F|nr:40S ribosomal protein S27.2 isoform X1 [Nerophis ophidion]